MDWTNLHRAAFNGDVERVRKLLKEGKNPNIKDEYGWTPLHWAALGGHADVARLLLEHGANPNAQVINGWTPLHMAAPRGHVDVVKLLLEHGANPNTQDINGYTPLHGAVYTGRVDVVKLLLEHGADPHVQSKYGDTPLHAVASWGRVDVVKLFLKHGANPNIKDYDGQTPLHSAASRGHVEVVKLFLEHGANPNTQDKSGNTPLHEATSKGYVGIVKLLLEHGADPTIKNKDGKTPLDLAREAGYDGVVSLIEEWLRRKPTAQPPPAQPPPFGGPPPTPPPVDVELVERLSGEAVRYVPVSPSGPSFDVQELELSGCVFFRCGAFFCIYRCMWQDAAVAVKVPVQYKVDFERGAPPHLTVAPPAVLKELETVKALIHRNVLHLAAAWPEYGVLAYEWGDGGSLRDQKLSGGDVLKALVHVAWGLRYLHSRGVVHGDLKPENVIVVGGVCKIADLASVRRLLSRLSGSRVGSCTFGFCAPEQVDVRLGAEARGRGFEDRVDVYQLANLALDLIGAETIDGSEWSRDKVEKAAREAEAVGLSDFVKNALELEPWKRPNAEEAAKRIAAEWKKRYG